MTGKPIAAKGQTCPFNGKDVSKVCHTCALYGHVMGTNPQTGEFIDQWACSLALLPTLMIENSQQQRQTGAAVESFRNEMVKANSNGTRLLASLPLLPVQYETLAPPRDVTAIEDQS